MTNEDRMTRHARRRSRGTWPVSYRWMALGTLAIYTAVGSKTINIASAQVTGRDRRHADPAPGAQPVFRFDISPGPLHDSVATFRTLTGLDVTFSEQPLESIVAPGVRGVFTASQALTRLLAQTGLAYRFASPASVIISIQPAASTLDVTGAAPVLGTSLPKYDAPLVDTPQTITAVTQTTIEQQAATTLRDTLRNVSGISLAAGEGGAQGDNLTIRGFTARNDLFIDGMRDFGSYYRDPFNIEEVEVLQGPSSVAFGRGSTGGVVNQATKLPHLQPAISIGVDAGTDLTRRITLDLDQPLPKFGQGAAFRLNLMGDAGNVAGRDIAANRRFGIAPSLALGLATDTRWTFSYLHQTADDTPDYGIPWLFNGPAPVNRANYYGFQDGNYLRTYDDIATARVEHDFNDHVTLRDQVRYANYIRDALITEGQIATPVTPATPLGAMTVNRHEIGVDSVESYLDEQLDLSATFRTGPVTHKLVTGIEAGRETSDPTRPTWTNVPSTSLLDPDPDQPFSGTATVTTRVNTAAVSAAAYALDTISLGRKWNVTGGFRWDRFDTNYTQSVAPASSFHRIDEMPSWRAALVYKPVPAASIYFDAGTSFNPSAESLSLTANNANLPPEKNLTTELGAKWDLSGGKLSLRTALFRTEKQNAREPDPDNPLLNVLSGNQRVDGAQLEINGRLTSRWQLLAGYAYLDGRVVSSNYYPATVGAQLANAPANTFNFWTTYRLPRHWEAGIGGNYVSSRTASSTAPLDPATGLTKEVPAYWVFNAMLEHPLGEHVDLQMNLNNLANRYYYDQIHPAHIVPGPGRAALLSLRFKF